MQQSKPERITLSDVVVCVGALLIAAGVGCIYWPAGVVAAGVVLVAIGLLVVD